MKYIALICLLFSFTQDQWPGFQVGQSVYVVAVKIDTSKSDLSAESDLKSHFQSRQKFTLAKSASSADFVFVVFTQYESEFERSKEFGASSHTRMKHALALAVPPQVYNDYKTDLDKLKEYALWQMDGTRDDTFVSAVFTRSVSPSNLVKQFHSYAFKKK